MSVIIWTIAAGVIIFSIGLISAIGSRRMQKKKKVARRKAPIPRPVGEVRSDAMNQAASGTDRWAVHKGEGVLAGVGQESAH